MTGRRDDVGSVEAGSGDNVVGDESGKLARAVEELLARASAPEPAGEAEQDVAQ